MKRDLIDVLQQMDMVQMETDEAGGREIAWYYYRDLIEDILEIPRGTLDSDV